MTDLATTLRRLNLLTSEAQLPPHGPLSLAMLCADGALQGGLSVARDVRPDELFGALTQRVGGLAKKLKVLDVVETGRTLRLVVALGNEELSWDVRDVEALVYELNARLRGDATSAAIAHLGEWEDDVQLWCLPKDKLAELLREPDFAPLNRKDLRAR